MSETTESVQAPQFDEYTNVTSTAIVADKSGKLWRFDPNRGVISPVDVWGVVADKSIQSSA